MNERAFRLDFFIAIAALLVSVLTTATLVYQTRVISDQYAATIWPYISGDATASPTALSFRIINDGLGPALIESAQLVVDGTAVDGWDGYFRAIARDPQTRAYFEQRRREAMAGTSMRGSMETSSIGPGTTIRPGESMTLLNVELPGAPIAAMDGHTIAVRICYCSLNKSCWMLDTTRGSAGQTQQVPACTSTAAIATAFFKSPFGPPHKRSP